ncbi:MAG TPA: class F sortase [Euzebyales bacterium]
MRPGLGATRRFAALAVLVVLLSGCAQLGRVPEATFDRTVSYFDSWAEAREEPDPAVRVAADLRDYAPDGSQARTAPVRVRLPSVGIASDLERLDLADDGAIQTPRDWQRAGWYRGGPRPGELGAAVILGHVDSKTGPAVFHRLSRLRPGDEILVRRADRSVAVFTVDRLEQHRKTRFPTDDVYFPTPEPTLRLVTCGGAFDREAGSYTDNLVVFATLDVIRS